jgi:hypothetical protein
MTYSSGGLIQAVDYNGFVSTTAGANVNATWNSAYGQSALATVSSLGTVSATQWSTLNTTIASMANHQNTSITSRSGPTAGSTIAIQSALNTDITNCYNNLYYAYASGSQYTAWTGTASQTNATGNLRNAWTITFTDTVTFPSASQASYFWNAGGLVKIQFSKSSTGYGGSDTDWNNFVNTICGTIYLSSDASSKVIAGTTYTGTTKIGGTGTPTTLTTGTGWNQLTTTPVTIYQQYDTAYTYTGDYVAVTAAATSSTVLTLVTSWFSAARATAGTTRAISGGTATTGITFGTAPTTVVTYFPPESTYLTNTWGTPTVASSVSAPAYV